VDNIDFQEIVAFTLPQKQDQEDQNKTIDDNESKNPVEENAKQINALLIALVCSFALIFVCFCLDFLFKQKG
jgi:hypothetical protein